MENLTGVPDVDKLILLSLDDKSLFNAASVNTYINSLMDESFWASKFQQKYGVTLWKYGVSHREIYREFSNLQGEKLVKRVIDYEFIELVERLIKDNDEDEDEILLMYAVKKDHLEVVKLLLDNGADIHANDDHALQLAAATGRLKIVKLLLDRGADINADDDYALRIAAANSRLKIVKLLLDRGADINADNGGALRWAAAKGHLEVVNLLLDNGANIHAYDNDALILASQNGHLEVVKLLLDKGADIHADDDYALEWAVENCHLEVIKLLLDKGAVASYNTTILINKLDPTLLNKSVNTNQCHGITKAKIRCKKTVRNGLYCSIHKK